MSYIEIENVVKDYGTFVALRGISLDVQEGEFVSLLGPSGCGKTSLLRSIAGLEDIQGGSITVSDRLLSRKGYTVPPERRNVGLIFQSYALWPHMTVLKNIAYGLKLRKWDKNRIAARVKEVLGVVGLEGLENRLPSQLSGGQMQRVAVARSLAAAPGVLLFDEPLSNLDAKLRETMRFELRRIQKSVGTTAVYVTHDQGEAMVISDRIVLMNHGEIVQQGTARDLYETPESEFAAKFVGFSNLIPAVIEYGGFNFRALDVPHRRCWVAAGVWKGAPRDLRRRSGHAVSPTGVNPDRAARQCGGQRRCRRATRESSRRRLRGQPVRRLLECRRVQGSCAGASEPDRGIRPWGRCQCGLRCAERVAGDEGYGAGGRGR